MDAESTQTRPTMGLVNDVLTHLSRLIRGEVALARAETEQSLRRAGTGIGLLAGAAILALVALNVFADAAILALVEAGVTAGWAALIVGGIVAVVALVLALRGRSALKPENLAPTRTASNVRRDVETLKETFTNGTSSEPR